MAPSSSRAPVTPLKKFVFSCLALLIGLAVPVLLLEGVLRFLPVREAMTSLPVNAGHPIFRFAPNRDFLWSRDWNFSIQISKHSNNYGFLNDQDYSAQEKTPLLAVIGDSYVEAAHVENEKAHHGLLAAKLSGKGRVYSFGSSGAALSQYLVYAEFAKKEFHPAAMVFVVVGNDFDESLLKYKRQPGHHFFAEEGGRLTLTRIDHRYSSMREMLKSSALVRYLFFNCELRLAALNGFFTGGPKDTLRFVGNTSFDNSPERLADSRQVVDAFLDQLPEKSGLPPREILFVLDGMRPHLYSEMGRAGAKGSYFDLMRRYFVEKARAEGFEVIDMQPRFRARHESDGARFEFPTDGHWNALGHELVAEAMTASSVYKRTFLKLTRSVDRFW